MSRPAPMAPSTTPQILFITATRLGDAVITTAVLAAALDRYRGAQVTVACGPVAAPLFRDHPNVRDVIELRKGPFARHWRTLWACCAGTVWTAVIDLRNSPIPWLIRANHRHVLTIPRKDGEPAIKHMGRGLNFDLGLPRLHIADWLHDQAAQYLGDDPRPILALAPAANWPPKQWPVDRFRAVITQLTAATGLLPGARVMVSAAPHEYDVAAAVWGDIEPERRIDLISDADPMEAAAGFACADLFIGNDSGLMHLAAAAGTPTIGLFGPTDDRVYAPSGRSIAVVRAPEAYDLLIADLDGGRLPPDRVMDGITVEAVIDAAQQLLRSEVAP